MKVLAALRTAHSNGEAQAGVDVDGDSIGDKTAEGVVDLMSTKESALRLAVDAAVTVLRVRAALALAFTLGFGFLFWFLWIFFFLVWFLWFIFFFKQKTAYEIASCLVGSEMCIRDRYHTVPAQVV